MKKALIASLTIAFVFTLCFSAMAQQQTSFRCGKMFVKEGASSVAVQAGCGEPVSKEDLGYGWERSGRRGPAKSSKSGSMARKPVTTM